MNEDGDPLRRRPREPYEPPEALRLTSKDFAYGDCVSGNSNTSYNRACYRGNQFVGNCITGKSPTGRCAAGLSPN